MERREFLKSIGAIVAAAAPAALLAEGGAGEAPEKPKLPRRTLGRTGVEVSVLALGGVVGMQREKTKEFDPAELANAAIDAGITYLDTAPSYNNGRSESNYGEVLARRRGEVLATKTGQRTRDGALREIEASLKRLRTDRVDLIQVHGARVDEDVGAWGRPDGVLAALRKLRDEKVVKFIGVTGHESADVMRRAIEVHDFDTILTTFNPTGKRRAFRETVLPLAASKKLGNIAMKVMGGGVGSLARGKPPRNDGASNHDDAPHQAASAELVRYALGLPISAAVVGMGSLEELRANVAAAREQPPLGEAERRALEAALA
jgi:aryl-alcohol dehydrogenase-like predicted oxidoreductase